MKIQKYIISKNNIEIHVEENAQVLTVMLEQNEIVVYMIIDEYEALRKRYFYIIPTGEKIPFRIDKDNYVGSIIKDSETIHVFQEIV